MHCKIINATYIDTKHCTTGIFLSICIAKNKLEYTATFSQKLYTCNTKQNSDDYLVSTGHSTYSCLSYCTKA